MTSTSSSMTMTSPTMMSNQLSKLPPSAIWRLEYNFTTHYRLPFSHINPSAMDFLSKKLINNSTWFNGYFRTNAVNTESPEFDCDKKCRQVQRCAIANVDYDDFRMCVTQARALSANETSKAILATISNYLVVHLALGLIFWICHFMNWRKKAH